ncbi:pyridoxamine 5'-phosphate oxidase family protein [Planosporangium sp. 12N6]|uniref:pyridoxamine 5'-phosphate oxidase family protein n=1 Tax=Planosporangium spinosum TaxID=3402278 RepID=UPI003CFBA0D6
MASWSEFAAVEPQLAASIHALVHQYGPGLGYLATIRPDGGPRLHPVSPFITRDGLYCFVIDSPKRRDLERDGRYALHSFPPETTDDEAYVSGMAHLITDPARVERYAIEMRAEPLADWRLFEFTVDVAMIVRHRQSPSPVDQFARAYRQVWRDPRPTLRCEVR